MSLEDSSLKATLVDILHLLDDETINEIHITPYKHDIGQVWIKKVNGDSEEALTYNKQSKIFLTADKINQVISFMAGSNKKIANYKQPILECSIPNLGHRFTAVLRPIAHICPFFNIHKFQNQLYSFKDYINYNKVIADLNELIKGNSTIIIAGCNGSGKTSFASSFIHEKRKLKPADHWVLLEDVPEIFVDVGSVQSAVTTNELTMDDLLKIAPKFMPDQLCVGEIKGMEAYTFLKLAQECTCLCTMNAVSTDDALVRFELMIKEHPHGLGVTKQQIVNAIDGILFIKKEKYELQDEHGNVIFGIKRSINVSKLSLLDNSQIVLVN